MRCGLTNCRAPSRLPVVFDLTVVAIDMDEASWCAIHCPDRRQVSAIEREKEEERRSIGRQRLGPSMRCPGDTEQP